MTATWNHFKTAILLGLMFGLIIALGAVIGGPRGVIIAALFGGLGAVISFYFSDKIAISAMRGQPAEKHAPELITMVERLARNANLPMPKVYICPQEAPNAFATGRNPKNAAVAVTHGALQLLSFDELEGVIAHELAHIKNRDTLISTIAAVIAGTLNAAQWLLIFGGNRQGVHPIMVLLMIVGAPIAAALIQMAISRSREFIADADAAHIAGTPNGLIGALRKLDGYAKRVPLQGASETQSHMFIVQPLSGGGFSSLFSTHPATEKRIQALEQLRTSDLYAA
ncbi:M48 family metalloprotease [Mucisphaera sp.]|uniref:M48 family metalloprotease n=1 Tax=Mucisphaera sp. TaxID=2913024 RepID=UPI003D10D0E2